MKNHQQHTPSGFSLFARCLFDTTKNKLDYHRGGDCMKEFCKLLKKHTTKIINYEEKEMIPLTEKEEKTRNKQKNVKYAKKNV